MVLERPYNLPTFCCTLTPAKSPSASPQSSKSQSSVSNPSNHHSSTLVAMAGTSTGSIDRAQKPVLTMAGHANPISGIVFLPKGDQVVTCSMDQTVRLWDTTTGEEEGELMQLGAMVNCVAVTKNETRGGVGRS
ncbi:hypothetical protein HYDPIDRAFT_119810 [Hydnomerulius pinastri MD-312]|uniref:Uncharacterized protein n=1 Tax=Hydnomerulius pinastri MD-312 TaxID=994086 RepID=A0A0C9W787_9AGAM|nr:hypothetical protein HYDPIDRAFT_119810 [Hydnomerulius pinastri MD-312]